MIGPVAIGLTRAEGLVLPAEVNELVLNELTSIEGLGAAHPTKLQV